jgi:clan AA aspartic protease (TIGR02281 family)
MHHTLTLLFILATLLAPSVSAGTIYKCKSPEGALLYQEKPCTEETKSVASWGSASGAPLVLVQGNNGHYFMDGTVNQHKLSFMIDTGASVVSIPQVMAASAGLSCQRQVMTKTANGLSHACTTTIQTLQFGAFTLKNVEALISPNLGQPLLGMNVLKQFRVEQDSGEMRLITKN